MTTADITGILESFVDYAASEGLTLESIAAADGEEVLFEHHFTYDKPRNIYSHTKSYMATAVGIAIDEGKLSLDDRLADVFPDKVPADADHRIREIRLRHLLTMSSGFDTDYLMNAQRRAGVGFPDYVSFMLSREIKVDPGSRFHYSTADSIMAGRMVEEAVGMRLGAYLYEKLFRPMDMPFPLWENDPEGHPIGGGGMHLKLTDMMKLGQLYLNKGIWKGERIVSEAWVDEASRTQIDNASFLEHPDIWVCGYGYQFWMLPQPGAYRADGAFGQITAILPEALDGKGIVVAIQNPEDGDFERVKLAFNERVLNRL